MAMLGVRTQAVAAPNFDRRSALPKVEALLASLNQQGLEPRVVTSLLGRLRLSDGLKLLKALEERNEANIYHYNALLNTFSKDSSWSHALAFLEKMNLQKVQKDAISCNAAIRACSLAECWQNAMALLQAMQQEMLRSDTISFNSVISGLSGSQWPLALQLFEEMERSSIPHSIVTANSVLASCAAAPMTNILWLLKAMEAQHLQKDVITFGSAIHACGADWKRAISFLQQMQDEKVPINLITRNAVIDACEEGKVWQVAIQLLDGADTIGFNTAISACGAEWTVALQLMREMHRQVQKDVITFNSAIAACDEARNWQMSFQLFQDMQGAQLVPNTRSYAAVIHCCEMEGLWPEALRLLGQMDQRGVEVNTMTYNSAINACEKASAWQLALHLFNTLESSRFLDPTEVSFGACAKALEQGGLWMEVLDLLVLMTLKSFPPDLRTSSAAISACAKGHVWLEAIDILEELLDVQMDVPSILVSAAYSACERQSIPAGARRTHFGGG